MGIYLPDYLALRLGDEEIHKISALGLAHLGDAVFELMVRSWLAESGRETARSLHRAAIGMVSAPAQARATEKMLPLLTEEETAVFKRGRNAKTSEVRHSSSLEEYHAATGLETLFGYLYLKGRTDRLGELFETCAVPPVAE